MIDAQEIINLIRDNLTPDGIGQVLRKFWPVVRIRKNIDGYFWCNCNVLLREGENYCNGCGKKLEWDV